MLDISIQHPKSKY